LSEVVARRLLLAVVAALVLAAPAAAQAPARDETLTMSDGTPLACTLWSPQGVEAIRVPAVMLFHGLGGKRQDMAPFAEALSSAGYAALACDARGHGASGGLFGLDGPRDVQDTRELFDWLAAQPGVNGDAIGAIGVSLGGGAVWNAAAAGVPFKAIVPIITWTDLREALAPQGLAKSGLVLYLAQLVPQARFDPTLLAALPALLTGGDLTQVSAIAAARSVASVLPRITVPTFLVQGRHDFLFDIDQALAAYRSLGGPKRLYLGDLGHPPAANPPAELPYLEQQVRLWLDRWLKNGTGSGGAAVSIATDPWTGKVATFASVPPTKRLTLSLPGRTTIRQGAKVVRSVRLKTAVETFGDGTVSFTASATGGWDHVVAVLSYGGTIVSEGGAPLTSSGTLRIKLLDEAVRIPRRARLTLTLAATSTAQSAANLLYAREVPAGATLRVGKVTLSLPVLKRTISR
jgi:alpha-beta hydrolase superfamily lysophospholipase